MAPRSAPVLVLLTTVSLALVGCDAPGFKSKTAKAPTSQLAQQPIGTTSITSATTGQNVIGAGMKQNPAVYAPGLTVSNIIAQSCGIAPRPAGDVTPTFDYDSTTLADADRQLLGDVAKCLTEGALKGRAVSLVGRADARGEPEYNMTLGESRASTVQRYMVDLGVGRERLRPTSRGEMDATGTNEEGWAHDRRVDIELVL